MIHYAQGNAPREMGDRTMSSTRIQKNQEASVTEFMKQMEVFRGHVAELQAMADNHIGADPDCILWGAVRQHGFLRETVIVSDDAGQFNIGRHALCWVHAERLVQKLDTTSRALRVDFTDLHRAAQERTGGASSRPDQPKLPCCSRQVDGLDWSSRGPAVFRFRLPC
jgi:hypothetical protein